MQTNLSFFPAVRSRLFVDRTYLTLQLLQIRFESYLRITPSYDEIDCLKSWIEAYKYGSDEAADYLNLYGIELLRDIRNDLSLCLEEAQKFDEESPSPMNLTGKGTDKISKAINMINDAEETFRNALFHEINC